MNTLDLIDITSHIRREYLCRDHETGRHYVADNPHHAMDPIIASRAMTITERWWLGEHPDALEVRAASDQPLTSLTVEVEYGDWQKR